MLHLCCVKHNNCGNLFTLSSSTITEQKQTAFSLQGYNTRKLPVLTKPVRYISLHEYILRSEHEDPSQPYKARMLYTYARSTKNMYHGMKIMYAQWRTCIMWWKSCTINEEHASGIRIVHAQWRTCITGWESCTLHGEHASWDENRARFMKNMYHAMRIVHASWRTCIMGWESFMLNEEHASWDENRARSMKNMHRGMGRVHASWRTYVSCDDDHAHARYVNFQIKCYY